MGIKRPGIGHIGTETGTAGALIALLRSLFLCYTFAHGSQNV